MSTRGAASLTILIGAFAFLFPAKTYSQVRGAPTGTCHEWRGKVLVPAPCRDDPTGTGRTNEPGPEPGPDPEVVRRRDEAREQNEQGIKARNAGKWALAAQHFQSAVEKDPDSGLYRENLAEAKRHIAIEEARRAKEEADRLERERRKAERRRGFKAARDKDSIRSVSSSELFGRKNSNPANSDLRGVGHRVERDLTPPQQAAWKQLHCAGSIVGSALEAVTPSPGQEPSFTEARYLLGEALNALNGQRLGVACADAPQFSGISGRAPDLAGALKKERELIERARVAVDQLEKARLLTDQERIARAYAEQKANEEAFEQRDAPVREQQRTINRKQQAKVGTTPHAASGKEPEAKASVEELKARKAIKQIDEERMALLNFEVEDLDAEPHPKKRATQRQRRP